MSRNATFWDRRRAAVEAEAEAIAAERQAAIEAEQRSALEEKSDEDILLELGLPDPDTMSEGDDFAAFMAKAVPERIRKRALRKLWRSNPVLACVDGLNDYDDDYLTGSYGSAPLQTTYQVGKGLLAHVLEAARQDEAEGDASGDDVKPLGKEDKLAEDIGKDVLADGVEAAAPDVAEDQGQETDHHTPRRMVFHFDGHSV